MSPVMFQRTYICMRYRLNAAQRKNELNANKFTSWWAWPRIHWERRTWRTAYVAPGSRCTRPCSWLWRRLCWGQAPWCSPWWSDCRAATRGRGDGLYSSATPRQTYWAGRRIHGSSWLENGHCGTTEKDRRDALHLRGTEEWNDLYLTNRTLLTCLGVAIETRMPSENTRPKNNRKNAQWKHEAEPNEPPNELNPKYT